MGLGNPGTRYAATRHNAGQRVVEEIARRLDAGKPASRYRGDYYEARGPGGKVALLVPTTYMNESGTSVGPAAGALRAKPGQVLVIHDEIDIPFGEIRTKLGGGVAGHNGLKSLDRGLGSRDFWRVRVGVDRPDSTDPEIVSAWVLGRFNEGQDAVRGLIEDAARETERLVDRLSEEGEDDSDE